VAILKRKAESENMALSDEVALSIGDCDPFDDVVKLEGAPAAAVRSVLNYRPQHHKEFARNEGSEGPGVRYPTGVQHRVHPA